MIGHDERHLEARETFQGKTNHASRRADQVLKAAKLSAVAMTVLGANLAEASTLPDGYLDLGSLKEVASARILVDGSLEVTLSDGSIHICAVGDFVVLEGGEIAISQAAAVELETAVLATMSDDDDDKVVPLAPVGAAAGLLGAGAESAGGGSGGGSGGVNDKAVIGGTTTGSFTNTMASV